MTQLVIATPIDGDVLTGRVTVAYAESVRALSHEMPVETVVGFAKDVVRARNHLVATVLRDFPKMTHVLWWDEDQWPEDRSIVRKMMASGAHVIGAPYTNKRPPLRWIHQLLSPCPAAMNGVQLVRFVGFGFTMTTRACLEEMSRSAARYRIKHPDGMKVANVFGQLYVAPDETVTEAEDKMLLSEDFSFCERWRGMGGQVAMLCDGGVIHHAGSHGWSVRDMGKVVVPSLE